MKAFVDTNVLVYWVDDSQRADQVERLLARRPVISVQVLNEFANVLRRRRGMALADIRVLSETLIDVCDVVELNVHTHQTALALMDRYHFSLYDANIVAAAGLSGCAILYSEDMQSGLNLTWPHFPGEGRLTIGNPFST